MQITANHPCWIWKHVYTETGTQVYLFFFLEFVSDDIITAHCNVPLGGQLGGCFHNPPLAPTFLQSGTPRFIALFIALSRFAGAACFTH